MAFPNALVPILEPGALAPHHSNLFNTGIPQARPQMPYDYPATSMLGFENMNRGQMQLMGQTILNSILTDDTFFLSLMPPVETEYKHFAFRTIVFDPALAQEVGDFGQPNIISSSRTEETGTLVRRGIGMSIDQNLLKPNRALDFASMVAAHLRQVVISVQEAMHFDVVDALVNTRRRGVYVDIAAKSGNREFTVEEIFEKRKMLFALIQRRDDCLNVLKTEMQNILNLYKGEADTLLIPFGCHSFISSNPGYNSNKEMGEDGARTKFDSKIPWSRLDGGYSVYVVKDFIIQNTVENLMKRTTQIGEYWVLTDRLPEEYYENDMRGTGIRYRSSMRTEYVFDESQNSWKPISLMDCINNSPCFDDNLEFRTPNNGPEDGSINTSTGAVYFGKIPISDWIKKTLSPRQQKFFTETGGTKLMAESEVRKLLGANPRVEQFSMPIASQKGDDTMDAIQLSSRLTVEHNITKPQALAAALCMISGDMEESNIPEVFKKKSQRTEIIVSQLRAANIRESTTEAIQEALMAGVTSKIGLPDDEYGFPPSRKRKPREEEEEEGGKEQEPAEGNFEYLDGNFLKALIEKNVFFPMNPICCRPFMTYDGQCVVACAGNGNTGKTFYIPGTWTQVVDSAQRLTGTYTYNSLAHIHNRQNVLTLDDVFISGYRGGANTRFLSYEEITEGDMDGRKKGSIIVYLTTYNDTLRDIKTLSLTGNYNLRIFENLTIADRNEDQFATAKYYRELLGFDDASITTGDTTNPPESEVERNYLMEPGAKLCYNPKDKLYNLLFKGDGHWKDITYQGCAQARIGKEQVARKGINKGFIDISS